LVDGGLGPMELPRTVPLSNYAEGIKKFLMKDDN